MLQILTALQLGQNNRVVELAGMHKVSRRTIFRDLKELRAVGIPYHYNARTGGYAIESEFLLPVVDLNLQEALSLLLLAHKASNQIQLPFKNSALLAALKIENNLPAKIRQYCNTALRNISINAGAQARIDLLDKIFAQLQEAILRKRVVNIRYYFHREQKSTVVDLSPYHLIYNDHTWHVLGKSGLYKEVRAFKLNRIKQLNTLDKCFIEDKEFDIHKYLGKAWSMIPEGRLYNVKLRFLAEVAHDVADVQWHSTQRVTFEDDGSAIVEFRVDGLNEITWWILSYGSRVQVLAPKIMRQKIIEIAQKVVKLSV
jgi:predicted DNA-binding transcriptional regulator YafY